MADIPESFIEMVADRVRAGKRIRRRVGERGRLHIDSPVPFLCVHRLAADRTDPGTSWLVLGESSYLVVDGDEATYPGLRRLIGALGEALSDDFKAILLIELWSGLHRSTALPVRALAAEPCFRIVMPGDGAGRAPVAALARALHRVEIAGSQARVQIVRNAAPAPPGMLPLLGADEARRMGALTIGLEVPPVYQDPLGDGAIFPRVLRHMHREISGALRQASFRFVHLQTSHRPEHFLTLGQRVLLRAVREADEQLAAINQAFDLLLAVTPVNVALAEGEFGAGGFRRSPSFHYRLLNFDPDVLKRRLYGISLELVEDPALGELLRDKREELDRQITLLHDRNTERFLYGSLQLYGGVDYEVWALAERILTATRSDRARGHRVRVSHAPDGHVDAAGFARRAREEIARYRQAWPELSADVEVRDDIAGLLVTRGRLLISATLSVPASRVESLIHHEIGTHVLTWHNAVAQPLKLLACGLPGYEEFQEGTAVMAEYLAGGLQPERLRLLAGRVLAVRRRIEGRTFPEVFGELRDGHGFGPHAAFTTTMRVFRGGGFTKDAIYLRGLARLLAYVGGGGELELLFLGKLSEPSLPIVRELRWRGVLRPPPLRPHFLDVEGAAQRLDQLRTGVEVTHLINQRLRGA